MGQEQGPVNRKKRGVSFDEATTVFLDEDGLLIPDPDHSDDEERFILLGTGRKVNLLTVVHCLRESETIIRIISARKGQEMKADNTMKEKVNEMREEYDFSNGIKNPYAKKLKKQVTINIDADVIDYFKKQSSASGIPYQTLINLYLVECMNMNKKLSIKWE